MSFTAAVDTVLLICCYQFIVYNNYVVTRFVSQTN